MKTIARRPFSRDQRTTIIYGMLAFVIIIVILQLWLLTATMNAWLGEMIRSFCRQRPPASAASDSLPDCSGISAASNARSAHADSEFSLVSGCSNHHNSGKAQSGRVPASCPEPVLAQEPAAGRILE